MPTKSKRGQPRKYNFNLKVGETKTLLNVDPCSVRAAAAQYSIRHKSGLWKYSVTTTGKEEKHGTTLTYIELKRIR